MFEDKKSWLKKALLFLLVSLAILILYFYYYVDVPKTVEILKSINLLVFFSAVGMSLLDVFFFTLAWQFFLYTLSARISFKKLFTFVWASTFVDLIVPAEAVSGEISRVYMASQEQKLDTGKVVASVIAQRIVSMVITLVSIVVTVVALAYTKHLADTILYYFASVVILLTIVFTTLLLVFCFKEKWTKKLINSLLIFLDYVTRKRWNEKIVKWRKDLSKIHVTFHRAIDSFRANPKGLILPVIFSILSWFCSVFVCYLVFVSLGEISISFSVIVFVYALTWALKSVPIGIPGEFVVPIMAMTIFYDILGIPVHVGAAAAILINVITAWIRAVIGFGAIQWVGIKILTRK